MPHMPPQVAPRHAAFLRTDFYGEAGRLRPLPVTEKIRLALLAVTLLPLRLSAGLFCVAAYYLLLRVVTALLPEGLLRFRIARAGGRFWSRACLFSLGFFKIKWVAVSPESSAQSPPPERCVAIVSNHLGWADILIHMSRFMPSFAARDGTQNMFMIGLIR